MNVSTLESLALKNWIIDVILDNCRTDFNAGISEGITARYQDDLIKVKYLKSGHKFSFVRVSLEYIEDTIGYNNVNSWTDSNESKLDKPLQKILDLLLEPGEHTLFNITPNFVE